MSAIKKRGRKLGKKTQEKLFKKRGNKWMLCSRGCGEEELVDSDVKSFICGRCVQTMVPPPEKPKTRLSDEEKKLRAERKLERARKREAKKNGIKLPDRTDLGFTRGWHLKKLFKVEVDGKMEYYARGQKITKAEAKKIEGDLENGKKVKKQNGKPRGWHFMKEFIDSDGNVYHRGKLVSKKKGRPVKKSAKRTKYNRV
jgi:hypothetical protein